VMKIKIPSTCLDSKHRSSSQ